MTTSNNGQMVQLELPFEQPAYELRDEVIPKPVGYHILVVMPEVKEAFDSGIIKSAKTMHHEHILSMVGLVVDMGEQAYKDPERFPFGPWCSVGDYVMFRTNSGTRFKVGDKEFRLLNDDTIEAIVSDPSAIRRVN